MAIYYIDPTTGNSGNDGLSPASAVTTFTNVMGTVGDPAEIFIRRDTTLDIVHDLTVTNFTAKRWPMPTDEGYASRPQAGIDAGWDADNDVNPTLPVDSGDCLIIPTAAGRTASLTFHQLDLECITNSTTYPYFIRMYDSDVSFEKLTIRGDNSTLRLIHFNGKSLSEGTTVSFEDVVIDNRSYATSEFGSLHSDLFAFNESDHRYFKTINFTNCDVRGLKSIFYFYLGGRENNHTEINIENSTFELGAYGLTWSGATYNDGHRSHVLVKVNNSTILSQTESSIFTQSFANNHGHGLELEATNSTFHGTGPLVSSADNQVTTSNTSRLYGIRLTDCTIDMESIYHNYAVSSDFYLLGDIVIKGGTLRNMTHILNFGGGGTESYGNKIYILNPYLDEVVNILYSNRSHADLLEMIVLRGVSISGYLVKGNIIGGMATLEDCTVSKELTSNACRNISVYATGCSVDSINGSGCFLKAIGSRVDSSSWVVSNGATGEFIDSHLVSHNEGIASKGSNASVSSSTISSFKPSEGTAIFVNSKVNGTVVTLLEEGISFTREISVGARDGNTESTRLTYSPSVSSEINGLVNDIFYSYVSGVTQLTVYAIFNSSDTADSAQGFVQVLSEGKLKTVPLVMDDDDGAWSDYPSDFTKKKFIADLTGYTIPNEARCRVSCSIAGSQDGDRQFAIDHNVVGA